MLRRSVLKLLLHILQNADRDTIPSLWLKLKGAAQFSSRPAKLADVRCASTCISVLMAMRKIARLPSIASAAQAASKLNHPLATETALRSSYRSFAHPKAPACKGRILHNMATYFPVKERASALMLGMRRVPVGPPLKTAFFRGRFPFIR